MSRIPFMRCNPSNRISGCINFVVLLTILFGVGSSVAQAQLRTIETDDQRLVYYGISHEYLVRHVARSFQNSLAFHRDMFDYTPSEKVNILLFDDSDFYNAGAGVVPNNIVTVSIAPADYSLEILPANERLNWAMHHELMHVVTGDAAVGSDKAFRALFAGKVSPNDADPISLLYSYLTAPRFYAPRWYKEGIAVFMETWMAGGMGRALSGYDEMVFRTKIRDDGYIYDMIGLESEGTAVDFQSGSNSYLYGTRFISYVAYAYGPEKVVEWSSHPPGSKGDLMAAFKDAIGKPIMDVWDEWIAWEHEFQAENLSVLRTNPTTVYRALSDRALGSVSRGRYDPTKQILYVAVNYPGHAAHIAAIDVNAGGGMKKVVGLKGARRNSVSSLALDPASQTLFYTTDDATGYRDLRSIDLESGRTQMLLKNARIGDLAFNQNDRSIWGVRHHLGISSLVRIPYPYTDYDLIYPFPYGQDLYDIDISPDGKYITGALLEISGEQALIRSETARQMDGDHDYETILSFDRGNPEGFVFSADGKYMYGSSYYTGASNIYRYDTEADEIAIVTNAETGFFRPAAVSADSLIVFRYTDQGFVPVMISSDPAEGVRAVKFLGQEIVNRYPQVTEWNAGDPNDVELDSLIRYQGPYNAFESLRVESAYPVVQGYKDFVSLGMRLNIADFIGFHRLRLLASYTPSETLPKDERFHANAQYAHGNVTLSGTYNGADFYDLFGPTKRSRKGYGLSVQYRKNILHDEPRSLHFSVGAAGYGGLQTLPDYQNVVASSSELYSTSTSLEYSNLTNSVGGINKEKGVSWGLHAGANYVTKAAFPAVSADYHLGIPLPISHASFWIHASGGQSFGKIEEPAASFYFGGFRNNWVDNHDEKQYQNAISFPGLDIDEIGGTNYAKLMTELVLPPIRFRRIGGTNLFLKWLRVSVFTAGLMTNLDREFDSEDPFSRRRAVDVGGQFDFRIMLFSKFRTTLSFGYAAAKEKDGKTQYETMVSLKVL